jgi:hypothetical protein
MSDAHGGQGLVIPVAAARISSLSLVSPSSDQDTAGEDGARCPVHG